MASAGAATLMAFLSTLSARRATPQKNVLKGFKIKSFKDNREHRDDVFVGVNEERFLIKRGVEIEGPHYVAEVIENSAKQDARTAEFV